MMKLKRDREEEDETGSFHGHGMTWFRGPMIGKESSGSVYIACRLIKPKRRRIFANINVPGLFTVKSAISDSDLMEEAMVLDHLHGCLHIRQMLGEEFTACGNGRKVVTNLLLEYCSGGNLDHLINRTGGRGLPESSVRQYTRHILLGLNRIHEVGYVYCALKPRNILLVPNDDTSKSTEFIAKIGDLGLARRVNESRKVKNLRMTDVKYMAPETLVENVQEPHSDIWALGCVVVEMLLGFSMWDGMTDSMIEKLLHDMANGQCDIELTGILSNEGKDFLKSCLVTKDDRLTAGALLNHPFVRELEENSADRALEEVEEVLEEVNTVCKTLESTEGDLEVAKELLDAAKDVLEALCKVACKEESQELSGLTMLEDYIPLHDDEEPVNSEVVVSSPSCPYHSNDDEENHEIIPSFLHDDDEEESLQLGSVDSSDFETDEEVNSYFC